MHRLRQGLQGDHGGQSHGDEAVIAGGQADLVRHHTMVGSRSGSGDPGKTERGSNGSHHLVRAFVPLIRKCWRTTGDHGNAGGPAKRQFFCRRRLGKEQRRRKDRDQHRIAHDGAIVIADQTTIAAAIGPLGIGHGQRARRLPRQIGSAMLPLVAAGRCVRRHHAEGERGGTASGDSGGDGLLGNRRFVINRQGGRITGRGTGDVADDATVFALIRELNAGEDQGAAGLAGEGGPVFLPLVAGWHGAGGDHGERELGASHQRGRHGRGGDDRCRDGNRWVAAGESVGPHRSVTAVAHAQRTAFAGATHHHAVRAQRKSRADRGIQRIEEIAAGEHQGPSKVTNLQLDVEIRFHRCGIGVDSHQPACRGEDVLVHIGLAADDPGKGDHAVIGKGDRRGGRVLIRHKAKAVRRAANDRDVVFLVVRPVVLALAPLRDVVIVGGPHDRRPGGGSAALALKVFRVRVLQAIVAQAHGVPHFMGDDAGNVRRGVVVHREGPARHRGGKVDARLAEAVRPCHASRPRGRRIRRRDDAAHAMSRPGVGVTAEDGGD